MDNLTDSEAKVGDIVVGVILVFFGIMTLPLTLYVVAWFRALIAIWW
jgi:hypothetical protein